MATSIIELAEPFFLKVLGIINQPTPGQNSNLQSLQKQLSADLQGIEQKVSSGSANVNNAEWQSLKKAMIYWADEVLTRHIEGWKDFVLEHEYYAERNRAWKFYVEGEQCIPTGSSEAAELFYLALVLGFVGDLEGAFKIELKTDLPGNRKDVAEARKHWAAQLQRRIRHENARDIQGEPLEGNVEPMSGRRGLDIAMTVFSVVALVFLILLGWMLKGGSS
ncbi:MAG: DotU family type IV/VI secretion system protein [Planctomycetaceae bacterium]